MKKLYGKVFLLTIFMLTINWQARAIGVDASSNTADFTLGGARSGNLTFTHTIAGAGEVLFVGITNNRTLTAVPVGSGCVGTLTTAGTVTAISYGARTDFERYTTPTLNLNSVVSGNNCVSVEIFRLKNPAVGTNTITVTIPNGGDYVYLGAVSLTGVNTFDSTAGALRSNTGTNNSPTLTVPTTPNDFVLDVLGAEYNSLTVVENPSQTRHWRQNGDSEPPPALYIGAGSTKPSLLANSVTTNWTLQNPSSWVLGGIQITEITTATFVTISGRVYSTQNRGANNILMALTDSAGEVHYASTNNTGFYSISNIRAGQTITIRPIAKSRSYTAQILSPTNDVSGVDFRPAGF